MNLLGPKCGYTEERFFLKDREGESLLTVSKYWLIAHFKMFAASN